MRRRGHDQKFLAQVLAVGVECDIALLTVEDPAFWEDVQPLKFGPLPRLQVRSGLQDSYSCAASRPARPHCRKESSVVLHLRPCVGPCSRQQQLMPL